MVGLQLVLCVLISTLSLCSLGAGLLGCGTREQIVSLDMELLPRSSISSTSVPFSHLPASNIINFAIDEFNVWCTYDRYYDNSTYVQLTFTSPVVITRLVSGGRTTSPYLRYVTNFTVEYSLSSSADDFTIFSTNAAGSPKFFHVPTVNTLFALEYPFLAQRVRFRPNAWYDSDVTSPEYICWTLLISGCRSSEATEVCQKALPISALPLHPSPLPPLPPLQPEPTVLICPPHPSSSPIGPAQAELVPKQTKDYQVLAIILPIALITILIVVVIVGVGVSLSIRGRGVVLSRNLTNRRGEQQHKYKELQWRRHTNSDTSMETCCAYETVTANGMHKNAEDAGSYKEEEVYEN